MKTPIFESIAGRQMIQKAADQAISRRKQRGKRVGSHDLYLHKENQAKIKEQIDRQAETRRNELVQHHAEKESEKQRVREEQERIKKEEEKIREDRIEKQKITEEILKAFTLEDRDVLHQLKMGSDPFYGFIVENPSKDLYEIISDVLSLLESNYQNFLFQHRPDVLKEKELPENLQEIAKKREQRVTPAYESLRKRIEGFRDKLG